MKKILALGLFLLASVVSGQEQTIQREKPGIKMIGDSSRKASVLVIPFETKLYMSQIDQQICSRYRISFEELVERMRLNLADIVAFKLEDVMPAYSLYKPNSDSIMRQLHYTYTSVNYTYRALENTTTNENKPVRDSVRTLSNPLRFPVKNKTEKKEEKQGGTRIENGQIVSEEDSREKFMDIDIINPKLLEELSTIYGSRYFVFINQLDLLYSPASTEKIRIKVHYSIFNLNGNKKFSGASIHFMPATISDLSVIKNDYFFLIATDITEKMKNGLKTP